MDDDKKKRGANKRPFAFMRWTSLLLAGACIAFLYLYLGQYTEADQIAYKELTHQEDTTDIVEAKTSKQLRKGVQKDIVIGQGRQLQLKSDASEVSLEKKGRHVEVVEHLQNVTCRLQNDHDFTVLHAADAAYHYQDGCLTAEDVHAQRWSMAEKTSKEADPSLPASRDSDTIKQSPIEASADHVHYHQGIMTLSGQAQIEHSQGMLLADQIVIPELDKAKHTIDTMTAEGNVTILYGDALTVNSDHALFKHHPETTEAFSGIITLNCHPGKSCRVATPNGDEIHAATMTIDTETRELHGTSPKGTLRSVSEASKPVHCTADHLVWNDQESKLRLLGNVQITQEGSCFQTAHDVLLVLKTIEGKKVLHGMETKGEASLTYHDPTKEGLIKYFPSNETLHNSTALSQDEYLLQSYGSLRIDHQKQEIKLRSPELPDGSVVKGKQVHMSDGKGEIFADKAFLKYDYIEQKMTPVRIVLQGNVKMTAPASQKTPSSQHYILADRADFIPQSKEIVLKSAKGKRVLLFDQGSNLEVSAPGIKFNRDHKIDQETVQGIGDVRFHFVDAECDELQRHFSLYEKIGTLKAHP